MAASRSESCAMPQKNRLIEFDVINERIGFPREGGVRAEDDVALVKADELFSGGNFQWPR